MAARAEQAATDLRRALAAMDPTPSIEIRFERARALILLARLANESNSRVTVRGYPFRGRG
jgi:hypothetical protein